MDRVATDATDVTLGMRRSREIGMTLSVAAETEGIDRLGGNSGWVCDERNIAVVLGVRLAVAVADIAGDAIPSVSVDRFSMRTRGESFDQFCMAGRTGSGWRLRCCRGYQHDDQEQGHQQPNLQHSTNKQRV